MNTKVENNTFLQFKIESLSSRVSLRLMLPEDCLLVGYKPTYFALQGTPDKCGEYKNQNR